MKFVPQELLSRVPALHDAVMADLVTRVDNLSEELEDMEKQNKNLARENRSLTKKYEKLDDASRNVTERLEAVTKQHDDQQRVARRATEEIWRLLEGDERLTPEKRTRIQRNLIAVNPDLNKDSLDWESLAQGVQQTAAAFKGLYNLFSTSSSSKH